MDKLGAMHVCLEDKSYHLARKDKAKIIEKYKVGDIIKNAVVKGYS